MNKIFKLLVLGFLIIGCKNNNTEKINSQKKVEFNQELANELKKMAKVDQIAAYIPKGEYKNMSKEEWNSFKDSVYKTHQKRMKQIFDKHGFVGIDLAGEQGSYDFWLMVQHSDHTPEFQKAVLEKMKIEVDNKNASSSNYAFLVDRVNLNTGKPQVYGTQVDYNFDKAQAIPKNLSDKENVNERRKIIGLEPLEVYLNFMSEGHFMMNKEFYSKKGITKPALYKTEKK